MATTTKASAEYEEETPQTGEGEKKVFISYLTCNFTRVVKSRVKNQELAQKLILELAFCLLSYFLCTPISLVVLVALFGSDMTPILGVSLREFLPLIITLYKKNYPTENVASDWR